MWWFSVCVILIDWLVSKIFVAIRSPCYKTYFLCQVHNTSLLNKLQFFLHKYSICSCYCSTLECYHILFIYWFTGSASFWQRVYWGSPPKNKETYTVCSSQVENGPLHCEGRLETQCSLFGDTSVFYNTHSSINGKIMHCDKTAYSLMATHKNSWFF
jgi:hypothetical protein